MSISSQLVLPSPTKIGLVFAFSLSLGAMHVTAADLRAPTAPGTLAPSQVQVPAPTVATGNGAIVQPSAKGTLSTIVRPEIKLPVKDNNLIVAPASISVKQIEVGPNEFPSATNAQYKVGFECTIRVTPAQKDYSKFPRHTCFLDQPRTSSLNGLNIVRVDSWPSADGVTTKIVMIADKNSVKNPNPHRIRTAFQLMHETSASANKVVLNDFVYADGLLKK